LKLKVNVAGVAQVASRKMLVIVDLDVSLTPDSYWQNAGNRVRAHQHFSITEEQRSRRGAQRKGSPR
jgi:hypothetical protein